MCFLLALDNLLAKELSRDFRLYHIVNRWSTMIRTNLKPNYVPLPNPNPSNPRDAAGHVTVQYFADYFSRRNF